MNITLSLIMLALIYGALAVLLGPAKARGNLWDYIEERMRK